MVNKYKLLFTIFSDILQVFGENCLNVLHLIIIVALLLLRMMVEVLGNLLYILTLFNTTIYLWWKTFKGIYIIPISKTRYMLYQGFNYWKFVPKLDSHAAIEERVLDNFVQLYTKFRHEGPYMKFCYIFVMIKNSSK